LITTARVEVAGIGIGIGFAMVKGRRWQGSLS